MIYSSHMAEIVDHANEAATSGPSPRECCGVILRNDGGTAYCPMLNNSEWPADSFEFYPRHWDQVRDRALCLVHSHYGDEMPGVLSPSDIESARLLKLPTVVYHTAGAWDYWDPLHWYPWPLRLQGSLTTLDSFVGWPFEYGRADCWSLARGWYKVTCGLDLPDYARGDIDELEDFEFNPFSSSYKSFGFEEIDHDDIQSNDLLVFRMGSKGEASHCAVVVDAGKGMGLHHLGQNLLSTTFQVSGWKSRLELVLRHPNANSTR
jgi:cell wall-associated NlpC family hydrolase